MPRYDYLCAECGSVEEVVKPMSRCGEEEYCDYCGSLMHKEISIPAVHGTRDSFGIGKEFVDDKTGQVIDTWKKWEKAGFSDPKDSPNRS